MKIICLAACLVLAFNNSVSQTRDEEAIRKVLEIQQVAWNSGSVEDFMKSYWVSDSLMFIGKSVTYGWRQTLDNYKKRYPDTASMGKLAFRLLEFKQLSKTYYFVVGKWDLQRSIGNVGGYFTLLFKKIEDRWVIIVDHTS